MQQGNHNIVVETSGATVQDSEAQNSESDLDYEVVTTQDTASGEFDPQTLNALGIDSRSDRRLSNNDQFSDDETHEKQVVSTDELGTSPKRVYLSDESSYLDHLQPSALQYECNDRSELADRPADACSSSENEADFTVNGCVGGSEHRQIAQLSAEDAAEEDTVMKNLDTDMALQPAAADDDDDGGGVDANCDNAGHGPVQGPVSDNDQSISTEVQANITAAELTESQELELVHHMEAAVTQRATEDSCNTTNLLDGESSSSGEAVFHDELQSDPSMLPSSLSTQQESPVSSPVVDDQAAGNNHGSLAVLDQHTANYQSWLYSAIFRAAQIGTIIYRYANL